MYGKAKTSKRKSARAAQPVRKRAASGKRHQQKRAGLVLPSAGAGNSTVRNNQPPALKISMNGRSGVQVDLMTLPKAVCLLDTEEKILKALQDLYPLVENCKEFQDNTRWSVSSPVADVFHSFFTKLLKLVKAESAKIILKDDKYRLMVKIGVFFDVPCPVIPVYFIPTLEKVNKDLFDLCFYMIILLNKQAKVGLWGEDNEAYIFDHIESELADYKCQPEGNEKEIAELEQAYADYSPKGTATLFLQRLEKTAASKRFWLKAFDAYKPKTAMDTDFYMWLRKGKELIVMNESIQDYISIPADIAKEMNKYEVIPGTPEDTCKILWRQDDWFYGQFESMQDSVSNEAGSLPFYLDKVIERFPDIEEADNCFAAKLLQFMKQGRKLEEKYRDTFSNPEKLMKALTPKPKRLIDIL